MGTYSASLRAIGETRALPATVQLEDGQISIAAGSHQIGTWSLADIQLEPLPNGYRMAAEGDQIIIELKELDAFREALEKGRFKRKPKLRGKESKSAASTKPASGRVERNTPVATRSGTTTSGRAAQPRTPGGKPGDAGLLSRGLDTLDQIIGRAQRRFGPYLPDWMFSRAMALILAIVLVVMVLFPALLLIIGGLTIAFGAVAYSDPMIASRWLPGRTQPPQVLLAGVAILLFGVLVGIVRS